MIQSISVNGEVHQIDYTTLANKPIIPAIPIVTSADQGKVLTVNSEGEWQPESLDIPEPVDPLPSVTSADQGKVLAVNSSGEWQPESMDPLPTVTADDQGKVLAVNSEGKWNAASMPYGTQISNLQRDLDNYEMSASPRLLPYGESSADEGKILIYDGYNWDFSDFTMPALQRQINRLETQLSQLQERVSSLASSLSDTEAYAANETLSLSGAGVSVSDEKLSIDDTAADVTGEKLSIA